MNRAMIVILALLYRDHVLGGLYVDAVQRGDAEAALAIEAEMVRPV